MATNFQTTTTGSGGKTASLREDLANYISNISRDLTPFTSSIGKSKATQTLHEWSTDTLADAAIQAADEGSSFAQSDGPVVERLGNKTQIFTKGIRVSGTLEAVDKAGRKSEFKYQTEKRGKEIARDIEATLVSAQTTASNDAAYRTANPGVSSSARLMGGYQSWAGAAVTADGGTLTQASGDGSDVASTSGGTAAAFSLDDVNEVLRSINGETSAAPSKVMMSTAQKVNFSNLINSSALNTRRNIDEKGKLRQSVDLYESDFGDVELVHNYLMGDSEVFVYDPSLLSLATLRPIHFRDINEDGDSLRSYMVCEHTLVAKSPSGNGIIVGTAL